VECKIGGVELARLRAPQALEADRKAAREDDQADRSPQLTGDPVEQPHGVRAGVVGFVDHDRAQCRHDQRSGAPAHGHGLKVALILQQQGRKGAALSVLRRARSALAQLGIDPPEQLARLERTIAATGTARAVSAA
jgi:hypothetical protein